MLSNLRLESVSFGLMALVVILEGCASVSHLEPYEPKRRDYESPVSLDTARVVRGNGALFSRQGQGTYLFADQRAMRVGDIVTVVIQEEADATREVDTDLSRSAANKVNINRFLGLLKLVGLEDGLSLDGGSESNFRSRGASSRSEYLKAVVPAIVRQVLPNGNLFVEGHRAILVNNEEQHFYLSGVVRPVDIDGNNAVVSQLVADAQIEFTGRGVMSEKQNPGWLQRGLDHASPF